MIEDIIIFTLSGIVGFFIISGFVWILYHFFKSIIKVNFLDIKFKNSMKERIVCSAIYIDDLKEDHMHKPENIKSGFVVSGLRHCNCFGTIESLSDCTIFDKSKKAQGFITSLNRFVDREEGAIIAKKAKQVKKTCVILFSEDLY